MQGKYRYNDVLILIGKKPCLQNYLCLISSFKCLSGNYFVLLLLSSFPPYILILTSEISIK